MKKKPINRKKEVEEKKSERFWREMMGTNKPRYVKRGGVIRQK